MKILQIILFLLTASGAGIGVSIYIADTIIKHQDSKIKLPWTNLFWRILYGICIVLMIFAAAFMSGERDRYKNKYERVEEPIYRRIR